MLFFGGLLGALLALVAALPAPQIAAGRPRVVTPQPQIDWQRSLADALAIAHAEGRPILVAINVDGESASDRIVRERYRDEEFVAWTRPFVCVIGHPWRHAAFDVDKNGERVPCPRLGQVTCGEHVALEPELFERWLGGERISPRHALIDLAGQASEGQASEDQKRFDLFLLFDLSVLDRALERAALETDPPWPAPPLAELAPEALAQRRDARARAELEHRALSSRDGAERLALVRAVGAHGDAGSLAALAAALFATNGLDPDVTAECERAARALGLERELATQLQSALRQAWVEGEPGLGAGRALLPLLARLAGDDVALRTWLVAWRTLGGALERVAAREALVAILGEEACVRLDGAIAAEGGPLELGPLLARAAQQPRAPAKVEPVPTDEELLAALETAERELAAKPDHPALARRFGQACSDLARRRIEQRTNDAGLFVEDAWTWLGRAAAGMPEDDDLALERARVAWLRSDFAEQERLASPVLARRKLLGAQPGGELSLAARAGRDDAAVEALRWVGDARARLWAARAPEDPFEAAAALLRGGRALAWVAASPEAGPVDFQSLASYLALVGLPQWERAALEAGLARECDSQLLRDAARAAFYERGASAEWAALGERLADRAPDSAACAWHAGHAWILRAEALRRAQDPEGALAAYANAARRFERSLALEPGYEESAGHYLALAHLGRGFAHLAALRRAEAADELVLALARRAAIGDVRDGLGAEALDLVDGALEWRKEGPSPVDARALAQRLSEAVPGEPRWLQAVADALLREALRADGRANAPLELAPELAWIAKAETNAPSAEGDALLARSVEVARMALQVSETPATRTTLAQSLAVEAERLLARGEWDRAKPMVAESARLAGLSAPASDATHAELAEVGAAVRERLGPARPVARPGR